MNNVNYICCDNSMPVECAEGRICVFCGHREDKLGVSKK
jgi:hypothetical protein